MEAWEKDFDWLRTRHYVKDALGTNDLPDLKGILFLVGLQEYGRIQEEFSKEEKQDLMHVAVCSLLEKEGYYTFKGRDQDGWPHWDISKKIPAQAIEEQEDLLRKKIIEYFDKHRVNEVI
jgi:hypothetical protein